MIVKIGLVKIEDLDGVVVPRQALWVCDRCRNLTLGKEPTECIPCERWSRRFEA